MPIPKDHIFYGLDLTDEQKHYVDSIYDNQMTIVNSPAGTGKTTLAVAVAKLLERDLVYTFAPIEEKKLGFTPGSPELKESKYLTGLYDALSEIREDSRFAIKSENNPDHINKMAWITAKSHVFMRGCNIKNSTLIVDECQNMTRGDLKKVLTRVHSSTKVILIGHTGQIDLPDEKKSGFEPFIEHFKNESYCQVVNLTHNFRGELAQHADKLKW